MYTAPALAAGVVLPQGYVQPVNIGFSVRWHDKLKAQVGDLENSGYASIFEGVDTLTFTTDELSIAGFALQKTGTVTIPDNEMTFILDTLYPPDGPINVTWGIARTAYNPAQAIPQTVIGAGIGDLPDGLSIGFAGL